VCGDTTSDINALKLLNEAVGARAGLRDAGPLLHRELSGMNLSRFVNASDRIAGRGRCFFFVLAIMSHCPGSHQKNFSVCARWILSMRPRTM